MLVRGPAVRGVLLPGVFGPRSDTWLLADAACREPLGSDARILELCAGPALAGISAAKSHGASLTTVDISRRAVINAAFNGHLNRVPIHARRGNLLGAVGDERFDMILANPPYVPGPAPPTHGPARAWDAGIDGRTVLDRICAEASGHSPSRARWACCWKTAAHNSRLTDARPGPDGRDRIRRPRTPATCRG
jgi:release factor glutamine methyltransferase